MRYAGALLAALLATACSINGYVKADEQQYREAAQCRTPSAGGEMPPLGRYVNPGIAIEYDRLTPEKIDEPYLTSTARDPRRMEQVYYDATHGNALASWLVCQAEVLARGIGRAAARHLASLKCHTIYTCKVAFEKLPFSEDTASGVRLLTILGEEFEAQATQQRIAQGLVGDALALLVGLKVATRISAHSPLARSQLPHKAKPRSPGAAPSGGLRSLGRAGKGRGVREVVGDVGGARKLFDQLRGANPATEVKPGVFTARGAKGGTVTFRATSKSGPPTVDVHGIEEGVRKIKFVDR